MLYHGIGRIINEHKSWGNKFIENLAADIKISFPEAKGYSVRNLKYMAKFAATYEDEKFVQQAVAQIPWGHTVVLLDKISDSTIRDGTHNMYSRQIDTHPVGNGYYPFRDIIRSECTEHTIRKRNA